MLDLAGDPVIPLGNYRSFALERRPPSCSIVWLGGYLGSKAVVAYQQRLRFDAETEELPKGLVTTFTVYRVVFQVLQHFTRRISRAARRETGRSDASPNLAARAHCPMATKAARLRR